MDVLPDDVVLPEIDFDDSEWSSAQSTPSSQTRQFQTLLMPSRLPPAPTFHPSLRKKKFTDRAPGTVVMGVGMDADGMAYMHPRALDKTW